MEKGDIGFVFPDVIHHYQVLTPGVNKATYLIASPFTIAKFADIMQSMAPEYPVIKAEKVEPEVYRVINAILETEQSDITVAQAYLQIVLARCIGKLNLVEKSNVGSNDLIYQTVSYISANFKKKFSLEEMAKDLGVSKYVLSRLFSKTFHRNFNQYLNDARLNYACHRLENTSDSITNICLDSGFESQRTFNRTFKERYKISPSDDRIGEAVVQRLTEGKRLKDEKADDPGDQIKQTLILIDPFLKRSSCAGGRITFFHPKSSFYRI